MLVPGVICTILLFADVKAITPTSNRVTVTYHSYQKSWNRAQEVCEALNGSLFTEDSLEKRAVLVKYRTEWNDPLDVWIGLHSLETGSNYIWVYGKPSCQAVDPLVYSHWQTGSALDDGTKRCGYEYFTDSEWTVGKCQWSVYNFVCERQENTSCTFNETTGTPNSSLSTQYFTLPSVSPDYTTCRDECLTSVHNDMNCWAAAYYSTMCVLYYMTDPFLFRESGSIEPSTHHLFIKDCYTSEIDTTDDTSTTSGNNADPTMGCTSIATSSTTSTSSASSSSLSNPTNSTSGSLSSTSPGTSQMAASSTLSSTASPVSSTASPVSSTASPVSSTASPISSTASPVSSTASPIPSTASTVSSSVSTVSSTVSPVSSSVSTVSSTASPVSSTASPISSTASPVSSTASPIPSTASTVSPNCACFCNDLKSLCRNFSTDPEFANLTSDEILEKLIVQLRVNKSTLSATVRKKTSATDNRPSSVSIGVVAAVFLTTEFALFVIGDVAQLAVYVYHKIQALII